MTAYPSAHGAIKHYALLCCLLALAAGPWLLAPATLRAQTVDELVVAVEADARVESERPDQNFGGERTISSDDDPQMIAYLRFRVSKQLPDIDGAKLRVYATSAAGTKPRMALAENEWDEDGVTWNNRPARRGSSLTFERGVSPGSWVEFDLSTLVRRGGTYTLMLFADTPDRLSIASRESDTPPTLLLALSEPVELTPAPNPSPTATATARPTNGPSTTPTATLRPTHGPSPTPTKQPTNGPSPTPTSTPRVTASPTPTVRPTALATSSPTLTPTPAPTPRADGPADFYVSPKGSNGDGRSWGSAWRDMGDIRWDRVRPGDIIDIGAGVYKESLDVGASGTAGKPIVLRARGNVQLFGGRATPLPYCEQADYVLEDSGGVAIDLRGQSHIYINGGDWGGLQVYGWRMGMAFDSSSHHITTRYVELYDNGVPSFDGLVWRPNSEAIQIYNADSLTFERVQIHDNGSDAFQIGEGISNLVVRESWLYNSRTDGPNSVFNHCVHPDGIQILTAQAPQTTSLTVEDSVLGPGLYHAFLQNTGRAEDVLFRDVLIYASQTSTIALRNSSGQGVTMDHVTSVRRDDNRLHLELSGASYTIRDSLFVGGGRLNVASATDLSNNYQHQTEGDSVGSERDPRFRDADGGDFTPTANLDGAGSRMRSVEQLLDR